MKRFEEPWAKHTERFEPETNPYAHFQGWEAWLKEQVRKKPSLVDPDEAEAWLFDDRPSFGDILLYSLCAEIHCHHVMRSPLYRLSRVAGSIRARWNDWKWKRAWRRMPTGMRGGTKGGEA